MKIKRLALTNVRSFRHRQELCPDKALTILIGPNGGGKTNLLDTLIDFLRSQFVVLFLPESISGTEEDPVLNNWRSSDLSRQVNFERHTEGQGDQVIELDLELTNGDAENIRAIQGDFDALAAKQGRGIDRAQLGRVADWNHELLKPGAVFSYELRNQALRPLSAGADLFLDYLKAFEAHRELRARFGFGALSLPTVHLSVLRTNQGLPLDVQLSGSNSTQVRRNLENAGARSSNGSLVQLAVHTLAEEYLSLINRMGIAPAEAELLKTKKCVMLTELLKEFGYGWRIVLTNRNTNSFSIRLTKQGKPLNVGWISSGEREVLSLAIAITLLDIRESLVIVDEPELHLHPVSQRRMLRLFLTLATQTGNQFVLATHSPLFVTPDSISYVARVFSAEGQSRISTVDASKIPNGRHAFQIVNAQNNEKIFFADKVVLVEGSSDEIFFTALISTLGLSAKKEIAVVRVGGKGLFSPYRAVLQAFAVPHIVIADRDYLKQVGTAPVRSLFQVIDARLKDMLADPTSRDGDALVESIQQAIKERDFSLLESVWPHIQANRGQLPNPLGDEERQLVEQDIGQLRQAGVAVLSHGSLEDYLPDGFRGKDQNKLIALVSEKEWIHRLPPDRLPELKDICAFAAA